MANKDRTLLVLKYLQEHSDGRRSVSTRDIRDMLEQNGHHATVLTVRRDIKAIRDVGYDVQIQEEEGKLTRYFYTDRALSLPEAQTLVDAVVAAQFLTPAKSAALIGMLKDMRCGISIIRTAICIAMIFIQSQHICSFMIRITIICIKRNSVGYLLIVLSSMMIGVPELIQSWMSFSECVMNA